MISTAEEILQEKFGHTSFRPGQKEAITSVLNGDDTLVMLPTGMGKSLCYQLPAYMKEGITLVVSPLLSLMQDQVENLKIQGEKGVVALNSLTSYSERRRIFKNIKDYRFIYTSPEMLQNNKVIKMLKKIEINFFVVDEAHCISHWGTDFRPDYLVLADVRKQLNNPTTMALTATATAQVRQEIIAFLGLDDKETKQIIQSVDRPAIKFAIDYCEGDKLEKLLYYIQNNEGPGIIYFMSKKLADRTASYLSREHQINAESYHADIDDDDKIKIQQQFLNNDIQIICATSAFGMGFDKKDIRLIIHYHLPASPEMYLQEVGRASRDGKEGLAVLLYQPGDEKIQERFLEESLPTKNMLKATAQNKTFGNQEALYKLATYFMQTHSHIDAALKTIDNRKQIKKEQLQYMMKYVFTKDCKREFLLNYFGESKKGTSESCCVSCGLKMPQLFEKMNQTSTQQFQKMQVVRPWQTIFKAIYNNK